MTVQQWLELARDAGLPWAESALNQADPAKLGNDALMLCNAVQHFAQWTATREGGVFWSVVHHLACAAESTESQLRALAKARKEAL